MSEQIEQLPAPPLRYPTQEHEDAANEIAARIDEWPLSSTFLVAGSIAQGTANAKSDVDSLCILESTPAVAAVATAVSEVPIAVSQFHGVVAIQLYVLDVKVSLRLIDFDFFKSLFKARHDLRRSIWKTHPVADGRTRNKPELLVRANGTVHHEPFRELADERAQGYVYELHLSDDLGPVFNVESTMLLGSSVVGGNDLNLAPSAEIAESVRSYADEHGKLAALGELTAAGYLGVEQKDAIEGYLAG